MSSKVLSWQELQNLQNEAEYGELTVATVAKRQVRILASLHFVLGSNDEEATVPYTSISVMLKIIEQFFQKKYKTENLVCWISDLLKRGYICEYEEGAPVTENYYSLTQHGITFFEEVWRTRDALFESNSRNSISSLH